ncbi:hypothetical protein [uncultured Fibrobacter sp.]|uniref:hypothetical protein n=1 Tax=uncultured Fibrobacter sp. TaxID=261512 RepID=UPI0025DA7AD5|nr:hypothetical protein [uncultured Fibrobacter sp.]
MKKLLKKSEMARLLAVAITAFACVCMWGCSDRVEFKWSDGRGTPLIAGFIDDSLVVAYDCRGWLETTETWNGGYSEDESCGHDRLLVYNYRVQEDGPRWSDSLTNKRGGYHWYQLTDSVFWRWEGKNVLLWKLGETAHEMKLSRKNEGCSQEFEINRIHQWLDDGFIALGGNLFAGEDSCQYAVLDTISGTLTYKRLDKNLEWIKVCDDVRAWDDDVYCLERKTENWSVLLSINNIVVDSIEFDIGREYAVYPALFAGSMLHMGDYVCSTTNGKVMKNPYVKSLADLTFINNDGRIVKY